MLSFDHRSESSISGTNPPIIPVADEISPDDWLEFPGTHFFCTITAIQQLGFHSGPHALTAGIVVTSPSCSIHTLLYFIFANRIPVYLAGILASRFYTISVMRTI